MRRDSHSSCRCRPPAHRTRRARWTPRNAAASGVLPEDPGSHPRGASGPARCAKASPDPGRECHSDGVASRPGREGRPQSVRLRTGGRHHRGCQDGLVANVAKYLNGQPVVGINPETKRNPGVLVPHPPQAIAALLAAASGSHVHEHAHQRTMVRATLDDGQTLFALNEIYVGHPSPQSVSYRIETPDGRTETALVLRGARRHRHRIDGLVPVCLARAPQRPSTSRRGPSDTLLVRSRSMAIPGDDDGPHGRQARVRRTADHHCRVRPRPFR